MAAQFGAETTGGNNVPGMEVRGFFCDNFRRYPLDPKTHGKIEVFIPPKIWVISHNP